MFRYMICNQPDEVIFEKQCVALLKRLPEMQLINELHVVDISWFRGYDYLGSKIDISNDYQVGGVFIDSEIDLLPFFQK